MECVRQVPALGVLAWLSWTFMRHNETLTRSVMDTLRQLHREHLDARKESRDALDRASAALGISSEVLRHIERTDS